MYTPSAEILEKYAQVLINFALNSGAGVKKGEVVRVIVPESAKPMYVPLRNTILKAGAIPMMDYLPDDVQIADYFKLASEEQLDFFADKFWRGLVDQIDHGVSIIAESDKYELADVDPKLIMRRQKAMKPLMEWRDAKEAAGKFTWTLGMYGTEAMAKEAGMSLEEYWEQIIKACYLDEADPIAKWKDTAKELERLRGELNKLEIDKLRIEAEGTDLIVGLGKHRQWLGGSGRNIPSFELFISPDWRRTEGKIAFNQPLYSYGNVVEGIKLEFKDGKVVKASATKNEHVLTAMVETEGADRIGEFSLTDGRLSKITRTMGETLFDENIGGPEGNTHLALGSAYRDSYPGEQMALTEEEWSDLGYNDSSVHTDIVSTTPRTVTAWLPDGSQKVIYKNGQFTL